MIDFLLFTNIIESVRIIFFARKAILFTMFDSNLFKKLFPRNVSLSAVTWHVYNGFIMLYPLTGGEPDVAH
jgi:hypothetical protein